MIIWNRPNPRKVYISKYTTIRKKVCETNITALRYCNKVRESGRQAWVDMNVCYYI